ncbi:NUDIX domain-containing protein [Natrialbaceae archaeon A-gly3]
MPQGTDSSPESDSPRAVVVPGMSDSDESGDGASHVVTAFLRNRGEILCLQRSDAVGTHTGQWGGVSGFAEGDRDEQVRREITEETGLEDAVSLVRSGRPVRFTDEELGRAWVVHPYLFDCAECEIELSEEHDAYEWVAPTEILTGERETVPKLWAAYERIAPTVRSIAADGDHGAAYLSVRALEVLRDRAGVLVSERGEYGDDPEEERGELAELARRLLEARPAMAVLRNRVNRAMADADPDTGAPGVLESALEGIERALEADEGATTEASAHAAGNVMTLSRSGTVLEALRAGEPDRVYVAESRPALEGRAVAEELAASGESVTLHTDAAAPYLLSREAIDCVLVGADTVLPDGRVVNKTGTRALALAASREGVPIYAVAATDKVSTREEVNLESGSRDAVYDGDGAIDVMNPTFDVTPADAVEGVVTERGTLSTDEVGGVSEELRHLGEWG